MIRRAIAFDLDNTLADSKSPISDRIAELLGRLLARVDVCVISGGRFEQFRTQLIDRLDVSSDRLRELHLMPTCGTRYYRFDVGAEVWQQVYAENIAADKKELIAVALEKGADALGFRDPKTWGDRIEDRGSQVTFSALGQRAPIAQKEAWDPTGSKKRALRDFVAAEVPDFEVRVGGATSVDVTRHGIDKAYGMRKLIQQLDISKPDLLFIGDQLGEGGNDYPVKAMGIDCLEVSCWQDTALAIETILAVTAE